MLADQWPPRALPPGRSHPGNGLGSATIGPGSGWGVVGVGAGEVGPVACDDGAGSAFPLSCPLPWSLVCPWSLPWALLLPASLVAACSVALAPWSLPCP